MFTYSVQYTYAIGDKPAARPGSTVSHAFHYNKALEPGASDEEIRGLVAAIESRPGGYKVLGFVGVTREEWVSTFCPPRPEEYGKEFLTDLGKGVGPRIEPAAYDGHWWRSNFTGKRIAPERWLLKTPIIENGKIVEPA